MTKSFLSLKELRIKITEKKDLARCCEHIVACISLHNMLLKNGGAAEGHIHEDLAEYNEGLVELGNDAEPTNSRSPDESFRKL